MILEGKDIILVKDIREKYQGEYRPNPRTIGRSMTNLGFRDMKVHTEIGNGFKITKELFYQIVCPLCSNFPNLSSFSSVSSVKKDLSNIKKKKEEKEAEDNMNITEHNPEHNEHNEHNEYKIEPNNPKISEVQHFILSNLMQPSTKKSGVNIEVLKQHSDPKNLFDTALKLLIEKNEVIEFKPGFVRLL